MTIFKMLAAAVSASVAVASPAVADTTIDFGSGAPGLFVQTTPLTIEYKPQGVVFSGVNGAGGSVLNDRGFTIKARSGTDFLAFNTFAGTGNRERLTFTSAASSVSIYLFAAANRAEMGLLGFDASGALVATSVREGRFGEFVNLSLTGFNFARVEFFSSADVFGADDLSFVTAAGAVPEPASWAMMIAGVGLVGGAMRRRKIATSVSFG